VKELTVEIKQALLAPFQAAEVRVRTQPYTAAYITARVVMTRLDEVIPWQWSFKLIGPGVVDRNGIMHQDGVLLIRHPDGTLNEFHDRGSAPPDLAKGQAKQAKHAVSDCFKRCAVHVGVGRYLYEITGVQGGRIPKGGLEKALAAVGYNGPWDDRHHGSIGGIREADMEDEFEDTHAAPSAPAAAPSASHTAPPEPKASENGKEAMPPALPAEKPAKNPAGARPNIKINAEQKARITAAVEQGGGNVNASMFLGWLTKNTANNAVTLDDVLAEDVDELIRKLEELATKAAKRKANS
jgi:hypothetical protein